MSFVNMSEVYSKAEDLLATTPIVMPFSDGDYMRWEVEIFRRRYAHEKTAVEEAEAAFCEACKGGTFTVDEAAAHTNTLRIAEAQRSNTRASISELVSSAASDIEFAKQQDQWIADDRRSIYDENPYNFCQYTIMHTTLPESPEAVRNAALLEAEQEFVNNMEEIKQEAREAGSRSSSSSGSSSSGSPSAKRSVVERFESHKAAIEEAYYAARLARY